MADDAPTPTPTMGDHVTSVNPMSVMKAVSFSEKDQLLAEKELQVSHMTLEQIL